MSRVQQRLIILLLLILLASWFGLNRGRPRPTEESFLGYLKEREEFVAPSYPLTLFSTNGPYGISMVSAIAIGRGNILYVGTYGGGLYKSEDGGKSWRYANRGLKDDFVVSLAVAQDQTLYAGTIRAGLFKSTDRAESWVQLDGGLGHAEIRAILTVSEREFYVGTERGIFRSTDGGNTWRSVHNGLRPVLVRTMVMGTDHTLYMGTQGEGIYKTRDPEKGWKSIGESLLFEPGVIETVVRAMVRDPEGNLYAGTLGSGVFKSADGGEFWRKSNEGLSSTSIRAMAVSGEGVLYVGTGRGVFVSRDRGAHWQEINEGLLSPPIESMALAEDGSLYVGTGTGVSYRPPGGKEWILLSDGLLIPKVRSVELGSKGEIYTVADGRGVLRSRDAGKSWIPQTEELSGTFPRAVISGEEGSLFLLSEEGLFGRPSKGEWRNLGTGVLPRVLSIASWNRRLFAGTERGLYRSGDQGEHWERVNEVEPEPIRQVQRGAAGVYLMTEGGIWTGGKTQDWKKIEPPFKMHLVALAVGPKDRLAIAGEEGLFMQDPDGKWRDALWRPLSNGRIRVVHFDPVFPDLIFLGTERGLFWTVDEGHRWNAAHNSKGLPFADAVNAVVSHPSGALFVGTETRGIQVGLARIKSTGWIQRFFPFLASLSRTVRK